MLRVRSCMINNGFCSFNNLFCVGLVIARIQDGLVFLFDAMFFNIGQVIPLFLCMAKVGASAGSSH